MKFVSTAASLLLLASLAVAQENKPAAQPEMPEGMKNTLQKYISAYEHRSMSDLIAVWPDLEKDKKEYGKIKRHFEDGSVSNEHVTLHPMETQALKDEAVVQCERTERFAKRESVETGGDMLRDRAPSQNAGPHEATKDIKKSDKIWMKLHKEGDNWVIVAISNKQISM